MAQLFRIAIIALRKAPGSKTTEPQVIIIGSVADPGDTKDGADWRYACYSLSEFKNLQEDIKKGVINPFADDSKQYVVSADELKEAIKYPNGFLVDEERAALEKLGLKDFLNKDLSVLSPNLKGRHTAIPFRNVERVFFFTYKGGNALDPFAALDVARFFNPNSKELKPPPFDKDRPASDRLGSRIILFPDFSADAPHGKLRGVALHLGIKVAINGHALARGSSKPDRHDTGMLLDLVLSEASSGAVKKNLWIPKPSSTSSNEEPEPNRGLRFDRLWLRCTLGPNKDNSDEAPIEKNNDLLAFARDHSKKRGVISDSAIDYVPALEALNLPHNNLVVKREFGFRALHCTDDLPGNDNINKIGWRFELWAFDYSKTFLRNSNTKAIVPPGVLEKPGDKIHILFAQEQRLADIKLDLQPERASHTILTARLGYGNMIRQDDTDITQSILAALDATIQRIHAGLKSVQDGRPLSLLPRLRLGSNGGVPWHVVGAIIDPTPGVRALFDAKGVQASGKYTIHLTTFEPRFIFNMWAGVSVFEKLLTTGAKSEAKATTEATFARLATEDRAYPRYRIGLLAPTIPDARAASFDNCSAGPAFQPAVSEIDKPATVAIGMRMALQIEELLGTVPPNWDIGTKPSEKGSHNIMIGALQFTLAKEPGHSAGFGNPCFILFQPLESGAGEDPSELPAGIDAVVKLPIITVKPANEDEPQGATLVSARERRRHPPLDEVDPDSPLLLPLKNPLDKGGNATSVILTLTSDEAVTRNRDHTISLSLSSISENSKDSETNSNTGKPVVGAEEAETLSSTTKSRSRVLVIEPRPFRIAAVDYDEVSGLSTSENNEVAVWNESGEGGLSWRIRDEAQTIDLLLPPQVIGEAMEKNRSGLPGLPADIIPSKPSAVRFGSLTALRIDPTFAETRFQEPGWNLRRILGFSLQRNPGAFLRDLRMELLYGLLARIHADDVKITEIAGAIGEPPPPLTEALTEEHLKRHAALIDAVLEAERSRLAVEKLWRNRPDDDLRLDGGVSFLIRRREKDEQGVWKGPATPLRWPTPGGVPENTGGLIEKNVVQATFSSSEQDEESFPGGLAWAFDSANVLMSVYAKPRSDGGSLRGVYLSALGGYGSQRALFDHRKSIVETETTQGRVHRYRLERVGRIACLWHRAKHVIVYERTVVPPAQFFNAAPIGLRQDEHLGRAIPRKVEEYIEILQPVRRYPEDGSSIRECGFVIGAEFKSVKIRVDGSWGRDVRREGWQVPLWSPAFLGLEDTKNPDAPSNLYPKPQIRLIMAGEGGREIPHEIAEPEKLFFYTSVVEGEDDNTDKWQPVRDVDFCDMPLPVVGRIKTESADLTDVMLPPEPTHALGYERFTLGLLPAKEAVALTHGRVLGGPVAALCNVTIARAAENNRSATAAVRNLGHELAASAANVRAEIDRRVGQVLGELEKLDRDTSPDEFKKKAATLLTNAKGKLGVKKLNDVIKEAHRGLGNIKGLSKPEKLCEGISAQLNQQVNGQIDRLAKIAEVNINQGTEWIGQRIDMAAGIATGAVERLGEIFDIAQTLAEDLEKAAIDPSLSDEAKKKVLKEAGLALEAIQAQISALTSRVKDRIGAAISQIDTIKNDLSSEFDLLRGKSHANLGGLEDAIFGQISEGRNEIINLIKQTTDQVDAVILALRKAGGALDDTSKEAAKTALESIDAVREALTSLSSKLSKSSISPAVWRLKQLLDQAIREVTKPLENIRDGAVGDSTKTLLDEIEKAKGNTAVGIQNRIELVAGQANGSVESVRKEIEAIIDTAMKPFNDEILTPATQFLSGLKAQLGAIQANVDLFFKPINDTLNDFSKKLGAANTTNTIPEELVDAATALTTSLKEANEKVVKIISDGGLALDDLTAQIQIARKALSDQVEQAKKSLESELTTQKNNVENELKQLISRYSNSCEAIEGFISEILKEGQQVAETIDGWICDALDIGNYDTEFTKIVNAAIDKPAKTIAEIKANAAKAAADFARESEAHARQLVGSIQETVRDVTGGADLQDLARRADGVYQKGDTALRALRALGDPPKTNNLGFNRPEVAYVLGEASKRGIDMTPALALVNRAADQVAATEQAGKAVGELLDSFGVRLPMNEITEQFIPESLKGLSVSDLIPNMGGIDLKGLLQGVGFPDLDDSKAVKIRHGFDKATMRASLEAELDVPFIEPATLMSLGPVKIVIDTARFTSFARITAGLDGSERKMKGRIFGDWRIVSGGQNILTFRQTGLDFDESGKIDFRIQPERIELADTLKFLTDLIGATGQKGGVSIEPFVRGGVPSGVATTLDMVLPPIQTGAFGISDLSLHVLFGIAALPRFEIVTELAIGTRMAPFTLNIWLLNGGGYVLQRVSYLPTAKPHPLLTYTLDIGILVGLGIGFSFGIVAGGVWLQVGCAVAVTWVTGGGDSSTTIRVFLLARGNVDVAGLITASIALLFEVTYDGERMIGAGTLTMRVKISMFYTLSVNEHIEYVFAGEKKKIEHSDEGYAEAYC
jgi:hypothetical protein